MDLLWKHFQSMTPVQDKILGIQSGSACTLIADV
jgi:hypothetical protein